MPYALHDRHCRIRVNGSYNPLTHALCRAGVCHQRSHAREQSRSRVTYVLGFTNSYCAWEDSNPLTHALRRGTKVATVRSVWESGATYVFDFTIFWCAKRIRITILSV